MLRVNDLTVELVNPATASHTPILHGISLQLEPGRILGVTGPSGGGKSTLISALAGLLPDSARVSASRFEFGVVEPATARAGDVTATNGEAVGGEAVGVEAVGVERLSGREWRSRLRTATDSRLFSISQDARSTLFPHRAIEWHLKRADSAARRTGHPTGDWTPVAALASVGFDEPGRYLSRLPGQVSTGECQRVQLAMADRLPLSCLLADEPFASVDPARKRILAGQLRRMASQGLAVLLVTHDLDLLRHTADRLMVIHNGRVVAEGTTDSILVTAVATEAVDDRPSDPESDSGSDLESNSESDPESISESDPDGPASEQLPVPLVSSVSLSKVFRHRPLWGRSSDTTALHNRTITIPAGSRMALLGESGAGKTTFARIVMNLDVATSGELCRYPQAAADTRWHNQLSTPQQNLLWRSFQMVYQDTDLVFDPAARLGDELVQVARVAFPEQSASQLWDQAGVWLRRFGLPDDALLASVTRLSGGEKRRAAIVRSLLAMRVAEPGSRVADRGQPAPAADRAANHAGNHASNHAGNHPLTSAAPDGFRRLLILDEPTVGLDRFWQERLIDELIAVQRDCGLTYFVISHDPQFVARFCNVVVKWEPCHAE